MSYDPGTDIAEQRKKRFETAQIVYMLYFGGLFFPPLALGGLVYAYLERGQDQAVDTHLNFLINTFWWGLVMIVTGLLLSLVLIGFLLLFFWVIWLLARLISGISIARRNRPIRAVETYGMKAV